VKPVISDKQGNYRLYYWSNATHHTKWSDSAQTFENGSGWGLSMDQQVMDPITLFARIGVQDKTVYEFDTVWSAGLSLAGNKWGRENDNIGFAFGSVSLSSDYKDTLAVSTSDETSFEVYYSYFTNDQLAFTADIQRVSNAKGISSFKDVTVAGVRAQILF